MGVSLRSTGTQAGMERMNFPNRAPSTPEAISFASESWSSSSFCCNALPAALSNCFSRLVMIEGKPAGIGMREDERRITHNNSRFVPHYFR